MTAHRGWRIAGQIATGVIAIAVVAVAVWAAMRSIRFAVEIAKAPGLRSEQATDEKSDETGWEKQFGSLEDFLERHPDRTTNATALELEKLGAAMGIPVTPVPQRPLPWDSSRPEQSPEYAGIRDTLRKHLKTQIARPTPDVDPPPEDVARFLRSHEAEMESIRTLLVTQEPPAWETNLRACLTPPPPDSREDTCADVKNPCDSGVWVLARLLLVDSLERARCGDASGALRSLEASWRLNLALRDVPIHGGHRVRPTSGQWEAMNLARYQAAVLRKIPSVPRVWSGRIVDHDYVHSVREAFVELGLWHRSGRELEWQLRQDADVHERVRRKLEREHVLWRLLPRGTENRLEAERRKHTAIFLGAEDTWCRRAVIEAGRSDPCTDAEPGVLEEKLMRAVPPVTVEDWLGYRFPGSSLLLKRAQESAESVREMIIHPVAGAFGDAHRTALIAELTAKVIEAKAIRDETGKWPDAIPGIEKSICDKAHWVYEAGPDGMRLSYSMADLGRKHRDDWSYVPMEYREGSPPQTQEDR